MSAKAILLDDVIFESSHNDELLSLARAFLMSEGDAKVAMARAMLELINT